MTDRPVAPVADLRLAGLSRLARTLAAARSLRELAELAAEEARFAFAAKTASLSRLEREHGLLRTLVNVGPLADGEERFPGEEVYRIAEYPLLQTMIDHARPWTVRVDDEDGDPSERALLARLGAHSGLAAPVLFEGRVWGELFATRETGTAPFSAADLAFAEAFAGLVSAGLAQVEHLTLVQRLAYEDPLTGLGNRRLVEEQLAAALAAHQAHGTPVSLVMADVNKLKQANDVFGHDAGDRALVAIASALSTAASRVPGAVAGRLGGDEFCVVLPGYGQDVAMALAEAFQRGAAQAPHGVGVAVGVASSDVEDGPLTVERLFALADGAQYEAKRSGASRPVVADPAAVRAERRAFRGRQPDGSTLEAVLDVAGSVRSARPEERLAALARVLHGECGAVGWVVSRVRSGAALPVLSAVDREGLLPSASVPVGGDHGWPARARTHGVLVEAVDEDEPLAGVRGCAAVVVAIAGDWQVELLLDSAAAAVELPLVLRAGMAVVLGG